MKKHLLSGLQYFLIGLNLIKKEKIRRFVIIPILINALVFFGIWYAGVHYFNLFTMWLDANLPIWLHWLDYILWFVYFIVMLFVTAYCFTMVANLIAAPFYSLLSECVQDYISDKKVPEESWLGLLMLLPRTLLRECHKLLYYLPRALLILVVSFIPIVNILSPVFWFLFGSWMQAVQYVDYPMDNNKISFKQMRSELLKRRSTNMMFGGVVMLLLMIPVVNIIVLPAAVAGATQLWVDMEITTVPSSGSEEG